MLQIDKSGQVVDARVQPRIHATLHRGEMKVVHGIIVHQTDTVTAQETLNSYKGAKPNGAHFLIDKDGTIYQTALLTKRTWHVGKLNARCLTQKACTPAELALFKAADKLKLKDKVSKISQIEMRKVVPARYPSNEDSIGIEIVGRCILAARYDSPKLSREERESRRGRLGVFEPVTSAQNSSLRWVIDELRATLTIARGEVWTHPTVSQKNSTEASTAVWTH